MNNQSEDRVLGYVGTYPVGDYKEQTEYEYLNVVTHKGSSYVCIKEEGCTAIEPPNEECWQLFAGKGDTGEKGDKGDTGPIGPKPVNGVDYNTNAEREEFKNAVVADSKTDLEKYIAEKETQLDNYTKEKETKLDDYVTDTVKPVIDTYVTDTTKKDIDAYEKEKEKVLDTYTDTKKTEIDNYVTNTSKPALDQYEKDKEVELETAKNTAISEYDAHAESVLTETNDLFNALDTEKVSGTELYIEDAKPCRIMNTEIGGMYKQETTAGANLLDTSDMLFNNGTLEQNGLTAKINTDGSIVINGTATANTCFKKSIKNILEDGNYYFYNFNNVTQSNSTYYMLIQGNKSTGYGSTDYYNARGYQTDNFIKDIITYDRTFDCTFVFINGFVANNLILYPEISKTKQTVFESYTGGNPSPNPDYPQEIMQVEEVKTYVTGKNCYNISNFTANTTIGSFRGHWIYLKPNTKYTISTNMVTNPDGSLSPIIGEPKLSVAYIVVTTNTETNTLDSSTNGVAISNAKSRTVLTGGTGALFVGYRAGQNSIPTMVTKGGYIQIEEGTVATEYEPYQNQTVAIDLKGNKLCAISDTIKDKLLIDKNGNVALQKNVNYSTFTAFTTVNGSFSESTQFILALSNCVKNVEQNSFNALSNCMLKIITNGGMGYYGTTSSGSVRVTVLNSLLNVTQEDTTSTKLNAAKTFLQNLQQTPEIYYPAEVPELIDLGQLTELPKTFEGINNIWAETNLGNTEIEIEYVQDVKKLLEKQAEQQNARLDNIEALLSTTETSALLLDNMQNDLEKEVE